MPEWNPDKKELEVILDKLDIMAEKSDSVFIGEEDAVCDIYTGQRIILN